MRPSLLIPPSAPPSDGLGRPWGNGAPRRPPALGLWARGQTARGRGRCLRWGTHLARPVRLRLRLRLLHLWAQVRLRLRLRLLLLLLLLVTRRVRRRELRPRLTVACSANLEPAPEAQAQAQALNPTPHSRPPPPPSPSPNHIPQVAAGPLPSISWVSSRVRRRRWTRLTP